MSNSDATKALLEISDELRAIAGNGLHYCESEYERARYEKVRTLAARTLALADSRSTAGIETEFRGDLGVRTPLVTADAAIFDERGRLLLTQRSDCGQWCMPGGACDVGESPAQAAERETREETGLAVTATKLYGLYDNRRYGLDHVVTQAYCATFAADVVGGELTITHETLAVDWFTEEQARELTLYRGHVVKVFDVFAIRRGELSAPVFH